MMKNLKQINYDIFWPFYYLLIWCQSDTSISARINCHCWHIRLSFFHVCILWIKLLLPLYAPSIKRIFKVNVICTVYDIFAALNRLETCTKGTLYSGVENFQLLYEMKKASSEMNVKFFSKNIFIKKVFTFCRYICTLAFSSWQKVLLCIL